MKNKNTLKINLIISVIILIGFIAVGITSYNTYSKIIKEDIVNISKLTAANIYSDISNTLTKPIFVSLTMANDSFLIKWLLAEKEGERSEDHIIQLRDYLMGIKNKYDYASVFLVSEASKYYYHYQGINKQISSEDEHDQWYFSFIDREVLYYLDIDTDEVNQNKLSVFVNCIVNDEAGNRLGVTGVGLEINEIQELLLHFETNFQLDAVLFDQDGIVQVGTDTNLITKENVFSTGLLAEYREEILAQKDQLRVQAVKADDFNGYAITRYIDDLNWYLLIRKDTSVIAKSFKIQLINDFLIFFTVLCLVLVIVNRILKNHQDTLLKMARQDHLTNLPNRRAFNDHARSLIEDCGNKDPVYAFVFDIDNFKRINDKYGHLTGDNILKLIGVICTQTLSVNGSVYRWGGDEYAGFIFGDETKVDELIKALLIKINEHGELKEYDITISMGLTRIGKSDLPDNVLYRADRGLYAVKEKGKNGYLIIS